MEAISELQEILHHYFPWNKSRISCLCKFIFAIIVAQTVNLTSVANVFFGNAKSDSHYKRLQRFIRWLPTFEAKAQEMLKDVLLSLLGRKDCPIRLAMDRTNWKFGKTHINLLVIGLWYHGVNIPLAWTSLGKAGNSCTSERIAIIKRLLKMLKKHRIAVLTADREFIGNEWFRFLVKEKIPFVIRVKNNTHMERPGNDYTVPVQCIFKRLRNKRKKTLQGRHKVFGIPLFIAAARNKDGELLVVVSNIIEKKLLKEYMKRWGIESLFSCLKKRGFRFEETHLTIKERISSLFFVLTIVTAWAMRSGVNTRKEIPTSIASHGRKRKGIFKRGLGVLKRCIVHISPHIQRLMRLVNLFIPKNTTQEAL